MSSAREIVNHLRTLTRKAGCRLLTAPAATQKWLQEDARLPPDLIDILSQSWPSEDLCLGAYDLWSLNHLSESARARIAFKAGFFLIGGAGNGDLLVVRRQPGSIDDCEIGLISHEELSENESALESIYTPICRGFLTLLNDAAVEGRLPLDFYAACKQNRGS